MRVLCKVLSNLTPGCDSVVLGLFLLCICLVIAVIALIIRQYLLRRLHDDYNDLIRKHKIKCREMQGLLAQQRDFFVISAKRVERYAGLERVMNARLIETEAFKRQYRATISEIKNSSVLKHPTARLRADALGRLNLVFIEDQYKKAAEQFFCGLLACHEEGILDMRAGVLLNFRQVDRLAADNLNRTFLERCWPFICKCARHPSLGHSAITILALLCADYLTAGAMRPFGFPTAEGLFVDFAFEYFKSENIIAGQEEFAKFIEEAVSPLFDRWRAVSEEGLPRISPVEMTELSAVEATHLEMAIRSGAHELSGVSGVIA